MNEIKRPRILYIGSGYDLARLATGIVHTARERDINLVIQVINQSKTPFVHFYEKLEEFVSKENIDGVIVYTSVLSSCMPYDRLENSFIRPFEYFPIVSIGSKIEGITSIIPGAKDGIKEAVNHLIRVHKMDKIAFINGPETNLMAKEKYLGYCEALLENNMPVDLSYVAPGNYRYEGGVQGVKILLDERNVACEAIVTANDLAAYGVLDELKKRKLVAGKDISVIGYDDLQKSRYLPIPLSSVSHPFYELGKCAVNTVLDIISGNVVGEEIVIPTKFIKRNTCGCSTFGNIFIKDEKEKSSLKNNFKLWQDSIIAKINDILPSSSFDKEKFNDYLERFLKYFNENPAYENAENEILILVNEILEFEIKNEIDVLFLWNKILEILSEFIRTFYENEKINIYMKIIDKIRVLLSEKTFGNQIIINQDINDNNQKLSVISSSLMTSFEKEKLLGLLKKALPTLKIKRCYIFLFQEEVTVDRNNNFALPEYIDLVLSYEERRDSKFIEKRIKTRDLLNDEILDKKESYIINLKPLHHNNIILGYMLIETGFQELLLSDFLQEDINNALYGAILIKRRKDTEDELKRTLITLEEYNNKLKQISENDEMTGLLNRRGFLSRAIHHSNLSKRQKTEFLIVFIDVDNLKKINDKYGHYTGDEAIILSSAVLKETFRDIDIICRLGGDEFIVMAVNSAESNIDSIKSRIENKLDEYNTKLEKPFVLSFSIGFCSSKNHENMTIEEMMKSADDDFYKNKKIKKANKKGNN
jgi:diguanylate cyclase (GGDEF)-like protein